MLLKPEFVLLGLVKRGKGFVRLGLLRAVFGLAAPTLLVAALVFAAFRWAKGFGSLPTAPRLWPVASGEERLMGDVFGCGKVLAVLPVWPKLFWGKLEADEAFGLAFVPLGAPKPLGSFPNVSAVESPFAPRAPEAELVVAAVGLAVLLFGAIPVEPIGSVDGPPDRGPARVGPPAWPHGFSRDAVGAVDGPAAGGWPTPVRATLPVKGGACCGLKFGERVDGGGTRGMRASAPAAVGATPAC